jgi:hypothetical protein
MNKIVVLFIFCYTYASKSSGLTSRNGSRIAAAALLTNNWIGRCGLMASLVAFQSVKSTHTGTILLF